MCLSYTFCSVGVRGWLAEAEGHLQGGWAGVQCGDLHGQEWPLQGYSYGAV